MCGLLTVDYKKQEQSLFVGSIVQGMLAALWQELIATVHETLKLIQHLCEKITLLQTQIDQLGEKS